MNNICQQCEYSYLEKCKDNNDCIKYKSYQQGRADGFQQGVDDTTKRYKDSYMARDIKQIRADAIEEFDRICEEARSHKFGVCDADFVIDVIKAKIKEQLKEKKNE